MTTPQGADTDSGEQRPISDEMPDGHEVERRILEADLRLSRSLIWDLQRRYFERDGIAAWREGVVPHYVTTNPMMARAYARLVHGYLRDMATAGLVGPGRPLYVMELGSGSGRFAYHFLKAFGAIMDHSPLGPVPVTFVMTDVADSTIDYWRRHPRLAPLAAEGRLDFARFDAERDCSVALLESGVILGPGSHDRPLVVIANYVFDGIRTDAFVVSEGTLKEGLVTVSAPSSAAADDPSVFADLALSFQGREIGQSYYCDAELDRIIESYGGRLSDTVLLFPSSAIRCIRDLTAATDGNLMLLSADKGWKDEKSLDNAPTPKLVAHGSFSLGVNYHAIAEFFRGRGGLVLEPDHPHSSLHVGAYVLGSAGGLVETRLAFHEAVEIVGPDELFTVMRTIGRDGDAGIAEILAALRISGWDFRVLVNCLADLKSGLDDATRTQRREIRHCLIEVWNNYLHIGEKDDLAFSIGLLMVMLEYYKDALDFFGYSQDFYGPDPAVLTNVALCKYRLGHLDEAADTVGRALALDPAQRTARALRLAIEDDLRCRQRT
jgi:tetratricopeptide (TPR) repeat protein